MKKDLKPIGIYLLIYIGAQLLIGLILGMIYPGNYMDMLEKWTVPMTFISYLVVAVIFLIIYHKKLSEKLKELTLTKMPTYFFPLMIKNK